MDILKDKKIYEEIFIKFLSLDVVYYLAENEWSDDDIDIFDWFRFVLGFIYCPDRLSARRLSYCLFMSLVQYFLFYVFNSWYQLLV